MYPLMTHRYAHSLVAEAEAFSDCSLLLLSPFSCCCRRHRHHRLRLGFSHLWCVSFPLPTACHLLFSHLQVARGRLCVFAWCFNCPSSRPPQVGRGRLIDVAANHSNGRHGAGPASCLRMGSMQRGDPLRRLCACLGKSDEHRARGEACVAHYSVFVRGNKCCSW